MTSPIVKAEGGWTAGPWKADHGFFIGPNGVAIGTCYGPHLDPKAAANTARIVYAVNNIDAREQTIAAQDARIAGLEAALREIIATTAPHDARNEYESGAKDAFKFCADIASAALEGSKPE